MKIAIIDTEDGSGITPAYRQLLPGCGIRGTAPPGYHGLPTHPHGAMCGWLAAVPVLARNLPLELVFVRIFDGTGRPIPGALDFVCDVLEKEKPDYVSQSWGAWDSDTASLPEYYRSFYGGFIERYLRLQEELGFVVFAAAGNDDRNDPDPDVDYPQALVPQRMHIIGACDRHGVPVEWSGDGRGVECVMWAHLVWSPDGSGKWHLWSGTSAAAPKACGACASLGLDDTGWRQRCAMTAQRPEDSPVLPHPKWGWGCMEEDWQHAVRPWNVEPPEKSGSRLHLRCRIPEYMDFLAVGLSSNAAAS